MRRGSAKAVFLASDASENARKRAEGFLAGRRALLVTLPYSKEQLSERLGKSGCSMAACTDFGLAAAFLSALAEGEDGDRFSEPAQEMRRRADRPRAAGTLKGNRGGNTMSSFEKYRVHEVAKDFNMTSKAITEILTKYATTPKNHMQVLEDGELSVIFEYLTQHNQCESMEDLFKVPEKSAQPKAAPTKAAEEKKPPRRRRRAPSSRPRSPSRASRSRSSRPSSPRSGSRSPISRGRCRKSALSTHAAAAT